MRIAEVSTTHIRVPLDTPYVFARGSLAAFDSVIVRIETDSGLVGIGESVPLPLGKGSDAAGLKRAIDGQIAGLLAGSDPGDIEALVERAMAATGGNVDAVAGVDLALWDLLGKHLGQPAYRLLGGLCQDPVPVDYTISADTPEKMTKKALAVYEDGFRGFVVKVIGTCVPEDVERVRVVRQSVPSSCTVRVDCNECFSRDTAIEFLTGIAGIGIELVEQPIPRGDMEGLRRCRRVGIPIAIDEGLETQDDAITLVREEACDIMNIKVPKVGGLLMCKRIAGIAAAAGMPVIVGGRTTLELSRCASRHFAASTWGARGRCHEGPGPASQALSDDVFSPRTTRATVREVGGGVRVEQGPGLGIDVSWAKVRRYAVGAGG